MFKTLSQLIISVEKELSLVAGTAVQTYAEDEIAHHLQQTFNDLFDSRWWDNFSSWQTFTLDGSTGKPNADISDTVRRYCDIEQMFRGGTSTPVLQTPRSINPTLLTGTTPLYRNAVPETTPNRIFQIYPITATGTVTAYVRSKPEEFDDDDIVAFDPDLLILTAAKNMCAADGGGSLQLQDIEQRRVQAETRVLANEQSKHVPINPTRYPNGLTEWQ